MAHNPYFQQVLAEMQSLHEKKNHDYAHDDNPYSNFEEAAQEAGVSVDTVFKVMIGIKSARIRELEAAGKTPTNESLADSYFDRLMYSALQISYRRFQLAHRIVPDGVREDQNQYGHGV